MLLLHILAAVAVAAAESVKIVGNKFYFDNGTQFYIKGVAYQQDSNAVTDPEDKFKDPLADFEACKRDLPYLLELQTNTLRVYAIDYNLNHDQCMKLFHDNGIYILADLSEPSTSINRAAPAWDVKLYERYTKTIDSLARYPNVLGFFAGNEVTNSAATSNAAPFIKAAIRDCKAHIKAKGHRNIPVGYSSSDDETRLKIADYFVCDDPLARADFLGVNMYEWCADSSFEKSGYKDRTEEYAKLAIPLFFSEYGCNEVQPRMFTEVGALYGPQMTSVWSGGIVYMYFQEANDYGLVELTNDGIKPLSDFEYLKNELLKISPSLTPMDEALSTHKPAAIPCPVQDDIWNASSVLPPTPDVKSCDCIHKSLSCIAKNGLNSQQNGELFDYLCSSMDCSELSFNGETGVYGDYSYCDTDVKLSLLMNKYYLDHGKLATACSFGGTSNIVKPKAAKCDLKPTSSLNSDQAAKSKKNAGSRALPSTAGLVVALGLLLSSS